LVSCSAIGVKCGGSEVLTDMRTVSLPADLCTRTEKKFGSLEPLLEYVLRDLLRDEAAQRDEAEQRMIEQRLRDLGYL
jgi:hypothetical protein